MAPTSGDHHKQQQQEDSSDEDAHIYIRAHTADGLYHWYLISNLEDISSSEFLTPVFDDDDAMIFKDAFAIVPLGSFIYVIGGYRRSPPLSDVNFSDPLGPEFTDPLTTNAVYCINTLLPNAGWKKAPPIMHADRALPYAFPYNGQVYVMGGCDSTTRPLSLAPLYAEVFDPISEKWEEAFVPIPESLARLDPLMHQISAAHRQLLVFGVNNEEGLLYSYHFDTEKWEKRYTARERFERWLGETMLDDVIYCYNWGGNIVCYDVNNHHLHPKTLKLSKEEKDMLPKPGYNDHYPEVQFLHLGGGKLCLVFEEFGVLGGPGYKLMNFVKFTPAKMLTPSGELVLVATQMTKHSCRVQAFCIDNCFAM